MTRNVRTPVVQGVLIGVLLSFAALLAGCNTVEGMGQDMRSGGRAVERAAE